MTHSHLPGATREDTTSIFVAGATGATGGRVTRLLLERGHHVRAFVHSADERSQKLADAGADVVVGDLHDLDAVAAALHGTRTGYFVYPIAPGLIEATAVFAQGAHEAGLAAIVNMSQISARRDAKSHAAQQHWIAERLLDHGPVPVTHLRPTFFAENLLLSVGDVTEHGVIRMPLGHGRHAPITVEDQAHVISAILTEPAPHAGATYPLYGPVEMDLFEIAAVFSTVLDRPITYQPVDYDDFAPQLTAAGFGPHLVQHLRHVSQDFQRGVFAGTNDVVARVGGKQPVTVAEFLERHRGDLSADADPVGPAVVTALRPRHRRSRGTHTQTGSISINAAPEKVWELITTVDSICEWYDTWDVVDNDTADLRLRVGTSFRLTRHRRGRDDTARCRITDLTAPTRLEWTQSAPHLPTMSVTFLLIPDADTGTTELRHTRTWSEP